MLHRCILISLCTFQTKPELLVSSRALGLEMIGRVGLENEKSEQISYLS